MARDLTIEGVKYTLAEVSAIRDEILARPAWVNVLTCAVDGGVCTQNSPCKCCNHRRFVQKHGTKNKHVPFETPGGFIARLEAFEAKVGIKREEEAVTHTVSRRAARAR